MTWNHARKQHIACVCVCVDRLHQYKTWGSSQGMVGNGHQNNKAEDPFNQVAHLVNDHYSYHAQLTFKLLSYYSCYTMASGLVRGGLVRSSLLSTKHSATTQWMIATRLAL